MSDNPQTFNRMALVSELKSLEDRVSQGPEATVVIGWENYKFLLDQMLALVDFVDAIKEQSLVRDATYNATLDIKSPVTVQIHD